MFDKYIIEETVSGRFYPRVRFLLFFYEYIESPVPGSILVSFYSLKEAREFVKEAKMKDFTKLKLEFLMRILKLLGFLYMILMLMILAFWLGQFFVYYTWSIHPFLTFLTIPLNLVFSLFPLVGFLILTERKF